MVAILNRDLEDQADLEALQALPTDVAILFTNGAETLTGVVSGPLVNSTKHISPINSLGPPQETIRESEKPGDVNEKASAQAGSSNIKTRKKIKRACHLSSQTQPLFRQTTGRFPGPLSFREVKKLARKKALIRDSKRIPKLKKSSSSSGNGFQRSVESSVPGEVSIPVSSSSFGAEGHPQVGRAARFFYKSKPPVPPSSVLSQGDFAHHQ